MRHGFFSNLFKRNITQDEIIAQNHIDEENGDIKLIILTESANLYLKQFFIARGIYPYEVCYSIEDASLALMREKTSVRLVIIEQGNGDMYNVSTRDDLQSLLSMCDGVYKKAIAFYSKQNFRYDNRGHGPEVVRWELFDGLASVANVLNSLGEHYIAADEDLESLKKGSIPAMQTKGEKVKCEVQALPADSHRDISNILNQMYTECAEGTGESIEQF